MKAILLVIMTMFGMFNTPDVQKSEWSFNVGEKPGVQLDWSFDVAAPGPADWTFAIDTAHEPVELVAAWSFYACDEKEHGKGDCEECHRDRLPTYKAAYAASKASGKFICLKVGGTLAEAEAEHAKAVKLGMEFAWSERGGSTEDGVEPNGVYRFAPPSGTACIVYPNDYVKPAEATPVVSRQVIVDNCPTGNCPQRQ